MILVTGGAGFIGSNFVLDWIRGAGEPIVNLDNLTYAAIWKIFPGWRTMPAIASCTATSLIVP